YPFGHGLSYTQFLFEDLQIDAGPIDCQKGQLQVSVRITNAGARKGVAVPQLYVRDLQASVSRPLKELKGFGKVTLLPKESKLVTVEVPTDMLGFTGVDGKRRVEPGAFFVMIGESSANIRLSAKVTLAGETRSLPQNWRMVGQLGMR
ncbi:MAG: beta-glucosidase, partial [Alphaproteobacteria bacterium]